MQARKGPGSKRQLDTRTDGGPPARKVKTGQRGLLAHTPVLALHGQVRFIHALLHMCTSLKVAAEGTCHGA
jgi:hypothetical protein